MFVPVWTMGEISKEQCENVSEAVASGMGLIGCHGGMCDAFRNNVLWQFMTGGNWVSHPGGDGVEYKVNDLKFGLLEASEGKIGNTLDRIILYCYHYDPDSKGYVVFAGNVMRLGGAITLILLGGLVGILFYRERQKKRKTLSVAVH